MPTILSNYIPLILLFAISFSSQNEIQKPFLKNEIVPLSSQPPSSKLYDFLIYPSNDKFKYCILPFLTSSKHLLKIFFHFRILYPNLSIEKFLPNSIVKTSVLDMKNLYLTYIFINEFSYFNPIICDSENDYRPVTLGSRANNSIYALFPENIIFPLKYHNQEASATFHYSGRCFYVATASQEKLTTIACGKIPTWWGIGRSADGFPDFVDCILKAHNLNCFKKFYFKLFYLYDKYNELLLKTRWWVFVRKFRDKDCPQKSLSGKILYKIFHLSFFYISYCLLYHAQMLPFHILAFPFELSFFLQQNFVYSGLITKYFMCFWTLPCFINFIRGVFLYDTLDVQISYSQISSRFSFGCWKDESSHFAVPIKPQEMKWPATYFIYKKHDQLREHGVDVCFKIVILLILVLQMFCDGFLYSIPLSPFMMMQEITNE